MVSDNFHAFQHRTNRPHYCNPLELWAKNIKKDSWTFSKRLDFRLNPLEFATFKNVIIKSRSSGLSYHKIAKAFSVSSRTVYELVKKTGHFVNPLKSMNWYIFKTKSLHVNITRIAAAYYSQLHAYRMGWITTFNIENILNGETIH